MKKIKISEYKFGTNHRRPRDNFTCLHNSFWTNETIPSSLWDAPVPRTMSHTEFITYLFSGNGLQEQASLFSPIFVTLAPSTIPKTLIHNTCWLNICFQINTFGCLLNSILILSTLCHFSALFWVFLILRGVFKKIQSRWQELEKVLILEGNC